MNIYQRLLDFLCQLDQHHIHYRLEHNREDSIMVLVATPMKHWEIEFFQDGHLETDVYVSSGVKSAEEAEAELERFGAENLE